MTHRRTSPFEATPTVLARSLHLAFAVLAAAAAVGTARANPLGGVVAAGQATISQPSPALTTINQSSHRAVIDWRSFGIGSGEAVRFNQPAPTSATLNRVVGNEPSSILGSLSANGRVYLVNQNGVFVGPDAQIDVSGLVLSTANIRNDDFMAGRMNFNEPGKPGARIVNEGRITAADGGLVAMVAPGVENRGVISARLGQVVLAGAPAWSLDLYGDGMVNIVLSPGGLNQIADATGKPLANYVDHSGKVTADGGRIWISAAAARGLVDGMVNISGELRATRVAQQGGEITLLGGDALNITGKVLATSADGKGGGIAASADKIVLAANSVLDASGATGGGTVQVGGAYQGASPVAGAATTAGTLRVEAGAQIKADATGAVGNGGQVVLWSENDTRFSGHVSARAGTSGGDGGLMEVSGKKYLAFDGTADGSAPKGNAGTLLLDPGSLTVADFGSGGFTASGADSTVAAGTINSVLRGGTSVALQADDNITINSQIDGRAPVGSVATPGGGLSLSAGGAVTVNKAIVLNDGSFTSTSGSFTQADGNVIATLGGKPIAITAGGNISTQYLLTAGDLNLASTGGSITANQALGLKLGDTPQPLANLNLSAAGSAATQGIFTTGNARFSAGGSVAVGEAIVGGTLNVAATSNFQMQGSAQVGGFVAGAPAAPIGGFAMAPATQLDAGAGGVSITAGGIGALGTIRSAAGIGLEATSGNITLGKLESTGAGAINVKSAGSIDLPQSASILSYGGKVQLTSGGSMQATGTVAANNPDLAAPAQAAGSIAMGAGGDLSVGQLVALGSVDLMSAGGSVTLGQSLGGDNANRPLVGSLRISAGKDVTTNGLNLAGSSAAGADGLRIEAGTAGPGRIFVNERIGVSAGNLHFGSATPTRDHGWDAVLRQGVYARNGNQNITFNVPVLADGTRINERWRSLLANPAPAAPVDVAPALADQLADMILIRVGLGNTEAQRLVQAGGGLRVVASTLPGNSSRVTQVCPPVAGCAGDDDFWMVPKVVISNQETPRLTDAGRIRLDGGIALAQRAAAGGAAANAAIKVIVPMSLSERVVDTRPTQTVDPSTGESIALSFRAFEVANATRIPDFTGDPAIDNVLPPERRLYLTENGQLRVDRLSLDLSDNAQLLPQADRLLFDDGTASRFDLRYFNGVAQVNETTGRREGAYTIDPSPPFGITFTRVGMNADTDVASIVYAAYPGHLGNGVSGQLSIDGATITPSGTFGFNSNSNPAGFSLPQVSSTPGVNLSSQILAALPPTADTVAIRPPVVPIRPSTGIDGSSQVVAAVSAIEDRAAKQDDSLCNGRQQQVVGRSAGDEADVGATTALRGAPRSVFLTNYALGDVSAQLTTADRSGIAGANRGDPCR